jgi:Pherophorin
MPCSNMMPQTLHAHRSLSQLQIAQLQSYDFASLLPPIASVESADAELVGNFPFCSCDQRQAHSPVRLVYLRSNTTIYGQETFCYSFELQPAALCAVADTSSPAPACCMQDVYKVEFQIGGLLHVAGCCSLHGGACGRVPKM